tara:strand:+ start:405 stop:1901 length:1497 start_codon:yes stop_codon:yes gene_type:complete
MSNPWAKTYSDLRRPYLEGKMAKKDYDGDGKVESGAKEYRGVVHNKIQQAKGGKADGKDTSSVKEMKEPPRMQKGAMAYDGPNKERSLAADRVLQKAKEKRKKMKKESSNWRDELGFIEEATKGEKLDIKTNVKNKINVNPDMKTEHHQKDAEGNVVDHDEEEVAIQEKRNGGDNDPCWDTHKKVGMKMKGGKLVNDCRPKNEERTPAVKGEMGDEYMKNVKKTIEASRNKANSTKHLETLKKNESYIPENVFKKLIQKAGAKIKANQKARDDYRKTNPGGTITKSQHMKQIIDAGGDPSHRMQNNSYEPQGEMVEELGNPLEKITTGITAGALKRLSSKGATGLGKGYMRNKVQGTSYNNPKYKDAVNAAAFGAGAAAVNAPLVGTQFAPKTTQKVMKGIANKVKSIIPQKNSYEPQGDVISEKKDKKGKGSGKKDACYHKVKRRSKVWPSAYASGRLVQCRKVGAANYGKSKSKNEETLLTQVEQEALKLFNEKTN